MRWTSSPDDPAGRVARAEDLDRAGRLGTLADLLRPLSPEEYAAAPVPSREDIRGALERGAEELRRSAMAPRRRIVDPGIRFR